MQSKTKHQDKQRKRPRARDSNVTKDDIGIEGDEAVAVDDDRDDVPLGLLFPDLLLAKKTHTVKVQSSTPMQVGSRRSDAHVASSSFPNNTTGVSASKLSEDDVSFFAHYCPLSPADALEQHETNIQQSIKSKKMQQTNTRSLRPARQFSLLKGNSSRQGGSITSEDDLQPRIVQRHRQPRNSILIDGKRHTMLPTAVAEVLLPHQCEGVEYILKRLLVDRGGCILGDYMGLGKTMQLVAAMSIILGTKIFSDRCALGFTEVPSLRRTQPEENKCKKKRAALRIVIVAPGAVVPHWATEFVRFGGSLAEICRKKTVKPVVPDLSTLKEEGGSSSTRSKTFRATDGLVGAEHHFRVFGEEASSHLLPASPSSCSSPAEPNRRSMMSLDDHRRDGGQNPSSGLDEHVENETISSEDEKEGEARDQSNDVDDDDDNGIDLSECAKTSSSSASLQTVIKPTTSNTTLDDHIIPEDYLTTATEEIILVPQKKRIKTQRKGRMVLVYEHLADDPFRDDLVLSFHRTGGILVISYSQLVRYSQTLLKPDILIIDEGHRIRNQCTMIANYMAQMKTKLRLIATGYPLQNNVGELHQLLDFVTCGETSCDDCLGSARDFKVYFHDPVARVTASCGPINFNCTSSEESKITREWELRRGLLLYHRVQPYILRRGLSVLSDLIQLPRSIYVVRVRPSMEQIKAYNWFASHCIFFDLPVVGSQLLLLPLSKVKIRAEINTSALRQLFSREGELLVSSAPSPKMLLLWSLLQTAKKQKRKVIVFSQFLGSLDECMDFVEEQNRRTEMQSEAGGGHISSSAIRIVRCDGTMPLGLRIANCAVFNDTASDVDVLAFSLRTGCEGINLISASLVISLDLSWNPALEHEAFARAYRIGQQRLLDVVMLLTVGSIEEVAFQRQVAKCLLSDACVDGEINHPPPPPLGGSQLNNSGISVVHRALTPSLSAANYGSTTLLEPTSSGGSGVGGGGGSVPPILIFLLWRLRGDGQSKFKTDFSSLKHLWRKTLATCQICHVWNCTPFSEKPFQLSQL